MKIIYYILWKVTAAIYWLLCVLPLYVRYKLNPCQENRTRYLVRKNKFSRVA